MLFISFFLSALINDTFIIEYRFKHFFNGCDFAFYYNSALLHWNEFNDTLLTSHEVPNEFLRHIAVSNPLIDYMFYPFMYLNFKSSYLLYIILAYILTFVSVIKYNEHTFTNLTLFVLMMVSYPFIASLEKGQLSLLLIPLFLLFYKNWKKESYFIALVVFSILTHLKLFPIYFFVFLFIFLIYIKQYRTVTVFSLLVMLWIGIHYNEYINMYNGIIHANDEWSKTGGLINHSIFSFNYFLHKINLFDLSVVFKTVSLGLFFIMLYFSFKMRNISTNIMLFLFIFSSIMPDSSFFYNLIIFLAFLLIYMYKENTLFEIIMLSIIVSYPLHMSYKGIVPDVVLGVVSIKFLPLFILMSYTVYKEYLNYKKERYVKT